MARDPRTLPAVLEAAVADWGDKPLILFDEGAVTYRELSERALGFAGALQALGE